MKQFPLMVATVVLTAVFPLEEAKAQNTVVLGPHTVLSGGEYSTGGGITVAVELRNLKGMAALCGAWSESRHLTIYLKGKSKKVLSNAVVLVNGNRAHQNLQFLKETNPTSSYTGEDGNCFELGRPWRSSDSSADIAISIPRQLVYFDRGKASAAEDIWFRQTETSNPAWGDGRPPTKRKSGPKIDTSENSNGKGFKP